MPAKLAGAQTTGSQMDSQVPLEPRLIAPGENGSSHAKRVSQDIFAKVERAKQEWEVTADALPQLVCLLDDLGRVIRANRTVERWGLGEVVSIPGRHVHELMHPGCTDPTCYLLSFLERRGAQDDAGNPFEMEVYDECLARHLLISYRPLPRHKRDGSNTGVLVVQDETARKQAEARLHQSTERLQGLNEIQRAILSACSAQDIAQAALTRVRSLVSFHQARVFLYEAETEEFLVLTADVNGEPHLRPGTRISRRAFLGSPERGPEELFSTDCLAQVDEPSEVESMLLREGIRSYISLPLVAEDEFIGCLSLGSFDENAFAGEALQVTQEVADLLAIAIRQAQLYRRLKRSNAELEEALQAKDEMLHNVSHELRTPLFIIMAGIELLRQEGGLLDARQKNAVDLLLTQGQRLHYMVSRLITLKAIDVNALQKVSVDVGSLLNNVVESWRLPVSNDKIKLSLELARDLLPLEGDPDLLAQVFYNLLDNAIKFSPAGGGIEIRACMEGPDVQVSVADQGIGIPEDKLEQIFERFSQLNTGLNRRFGGMGIGLTLCRSIVEAHGGRIWACSAGEGLGSTFHVTLPVSRNR